MAGGLTLDAGALIAAERASEVFRAVWFEAVRRHAIITIPAPALAQAWRGRNPVIDRLLSACVVEPFTEQLAKAVGRLLARSRSNDVVDATVVVGAAARGDAIATSDPADLRRLLLALRSASTPQLIQL